MLANDPARRAAPVDFDKLEARLPELRERYVNASPFPHIVLEDFLDPEVAGAAIGSFPTLDPEWLSFVHVNERKYSNIDPATWAEPLRLVLDDLQSPRFVSFLKELTGIDNLLIDDTLEGGGLHQTPSGGFLNIHADFTVHPKKRTWRRRVNLLLYLNAEWPDSYGGQLELWSRDMKTLERKVAPIANRVVIFNTDHDSYHGHPEPLTCPPSTTRRSLALYYFTAEDAPAVHSTDYRARPGDGPRSILIYADKELLRAYDWIKRRSGISDATASRWLRRFGRLTGRRHRS